MDPRDDILNNAINKDDVFIIDCRNPGNNTHIRLHVGGVVMMTVLRCWWFPHVDDLWNVNTRSPTSQIDHQQLKVVTNNIYKPSPTFVTNIDVTNDNFLIIFKIVHNLWTITVVSTLSRIFVLSRTSQQFSFLLGF